MLLALSVISAGGPDLGPTAYKVFDESGGSIGRLENNDWTLPDPEKFVSSRHVVIAFRSGAFYLEDTSTNGTFINARDCPASKLEATLINDGDRIFIGDYEILAQLIDYGAGVIERTAVPLRESAITVSAPLELVAEPTVRAAALEVPAAVDERLAAEFGPQELLAALGLDPTHVDRSIFQHLGRIIRTVVQGMVEALQARAEVKNNFRMSMTSIRPVENNPLKFSLNADDALHNLFVKRNPGYLGAQEAFQEGFQDIAFHQVAMLAGIRAGYESMLSKFDPAQLEHSYARKLRRTSLLRLANPMKYWELYREHFEDVSKDGEAGFQLLFGEEFARAYNEQLLKLAAAARGRQR
jgi:predicted component of type VI protein secretion system